MFFYRCMANKICGQNQSWHSKQMRQNDMHAKDVEIGDRDTSRRAAHPLPYV